MPEKEIQKLLEAWKDNKVLSEVEKTTSSSKGKKRKGLTVNMSRMPGTELHDNGDD